MAWTEPLKSGRYRGCYRDRHGDKRYLPDTYAQKAEAEREAWRVEDEVRKRPAHKKRAGKIAWAEWAEKWWPTRKVEPSTLRSDAHRRRNHLEPRWGAVALEDFERGKVQEWVDELADSRMAPSTVAKCYSLLSASLKAAVIDGRIDANPCVSIELPPIAPGDERYLERDEYRALRDAMPEHRWKVLCDLLVGTGMRWGEAVAVHRRRVNRTQGRLDVHESYDAASGLIKAYPKGKTKRSVPVTAELLETLNEWADTTPAVCGTPHTSDSVCRGGLLLAEADGTVLGYSAFEKYIWRPAVQAAGLEHTRIHDLRHTYASWLIQNGVTLDQIQLLLGHKSAQTTQRYAHLVDTQWGTIRTALGGTAPKTDSATTRENGAPDLPHVDHETEGGKIVHLDRWRRSTGA